MKAMTAAVGPVFGIVEVVAAVCGAGVEVAADCEVLSVVLALLSVGVVVGAGVAVCAGVDLLVDGDEFVAGLSLDLLLGFCEFAACCD